MEVGLGVAVFVAGTGVTVYVAIGRGVAGGVDVLSSVGVLVIGVWQILVVSL